MEIKVTKQEYQGCLHQFVVTVIVSRDETEIFADSVRAVGYALYRNLNWEWWNSENARVYEQAFSEERTWGLEIYASPFFEIGCDEKPLKWGDHYDFLDRDGNPMRVSLTHVVGPDWCERIALFREEQGGKFQNYEFVLGGDRRFVPTK